MKPDAGRVGEEKSRVTSGYGFTMPGGWWVVGHRWGWKMVVGGRRGGVGGR